MNNKGVSAVISVVLMIAMTIAVASTVYLYITGGLSKCQSENEYFDVTGIVKDTSYHGGSIRIDFENKSLSIHGSRNNFIPIYDIYNLIIPNVNYTFFCHTECVQSDGNTIHWFNGVVCDKIIVNKR